MRTEQAEALSKRVINTWRLTPPLTEWVDVLRALDYELAVTAFARLRVEVDGAMSIARFVAEYRARLGARRQAEDAEHPPAQCEACSGTGWLDAPDLVLGADDGERRYSQVTSCRCTAGRDAARVHEAILRTNGARPVPARQPEQLTDETLFVAP